MEVEHPEILDELRQRIRGGEEAVGAMRYLIGRLQLGAESRLIVMRYFIAAFSLQISEAMWLGAWDYFAGADRAEDWVNAQVQPFLARYFEQG